MTLSIITINYNNCDWLQKTIDSVLAQTWKDYEWIVIDGGSTDGSRELIEQYQEHFAYWCSEPDKGVYNAMNKGIAKAKGEYLLFLNSGDRLYDPAVLSKVWSKEHYADIISGQVIYANGHLLRTCDHSIAKQLILDTLNHQGSFIKRELFQSYKYSEDYKIVSDWMAWIQWLLFENRSFEYVSTIIAIQEVVGISSERSEVERERERALKEFFGSRMAVELPVVYAKLEKPIIKRILYLETHGRLLFQFLHYFTAILVKIHDFFCHKTSFSRYEESKKR
ncbi:MAG: glycosyltransferase [Bacteroidaceae bacterium]|nr:glycosyltransferase [Bacteroidaceae bacterium]